MKGFFEDLRLRMPILFNKATKAVFPNCGGTFGMKTMEQKHKYSTQTWKTAPGGQLFMDQGCRVVLFLAALGRAPQKGWPQQVFLERFET